MWLSAQEWYWEFLYANRFHTNEEEHFHHAGTILFVKGTQTKNGQSTDYRTAIGAATRYSLQTMIE